jgi:hypothetical protein
MHTYIHACMHAHIYVYTYMYIHIIAEWNAIDSLLGRPCLVDRFTDAVFDLISLLEIDYNNLFRCQCEGEIIDLERLIMTYDNSCKLFEYILNRWPAMANNLDCVIDPLHHSGHVNCSPLYHSKKNLATKHMNSSLVEQKNKFIQHLASSVAHMGQIRVMVYIRYAPSCFRAHFLIYAFQYIHVYTHICAYIHTHIRACIHANAGIHKYALHTYTHTYIYTYTYTHTYIYITYTYTHTYIYNTCKHSCMLARIHANASTHACTYIYTHKYTQIQICILAGIIWP